MAIQWIAGDTFTCLSGDTKPTLVPVNTKAFETNTGDTYRFNGTSWALEAGGGGGGPSATETFSNKTISFDTNTFPLTPSSTYYTVYRTGSTTKCRDNVAGTVVSSSATNPEAPIQFACDSLTRRSLYIAEGTYNLLAGMLLDTGTTESRIYLDAGALLNAPNGFTGSIWGINGGVSLIKIQGGKYAEAGTPSALWTCFSLNNQATGGINSCQIDDCYIRWCLHGIRMTSGTSASWVNSNRFSHIFMDRIVNGVSFVQSVAKGGGNGMNLNTFWDIIINLVPAVSAPPVSLRGFRDISGASNQFYGVAVWDTPAGAISANLTTEATNTLIVGGKMTYNIADLGINTLIWDAEHGLKMGGSDFASNKAILGPTSQQWGAMNGIMEDPIGNGTGCLASVVIPTGCVVTNGTFTFADGLFTRYTSTATSGDNAGFRTSFPVTCRGWYPYFECNFRVPTGSTTNSRLWIGWGAASEPTGEDAFNALTGVGVGFRVADTNFMFWRNEGTGATSYSDNFLIAKDSAIHNVKLFANDATASFQVVFDGISVTSTSNVPAQTTPLYPMMQIETTSGAKALDRFSVDIRPGKNSLL